VLVVGGSLGAAALNEAMPKALALLAPEDRPLVTHQAGTKQIEALRAGYQAAGVSGELLPFIDDMAARYAGADLVICRAGALTVAELAAVGVASVLVPFPMRWMTTRPATPAFWPMPARRSCCPRPN
jgi:UDP-N-acetylglucosamine--N-acetylmuramyl-(pentapeptide) pyrophosphoryl-undecaprenol N-acetylglucosamine transferase